MVNAYTVSVLPVRNSGFESIMAKMPTVWDVSMPASTNPKRSPSMEVAGMPLRNASTPRIRSRLSNSLVNVSSVGMPSKNSRVPIGVLTESGVMILTGIAWLKPGVASSAVLTMISPVTRVMGVPHIG